jgi:hypothetical protein
MLQKRVTAGILVGTMLGLMTGVAYAQLMPSFKLNDDTKPRMTQEEYEKQQALDNAYKSATKKIPDKKVGDPWATVRPEPTSPAASKDKQAAKTKPQ